MKTLKFSVIFIGLLIAFASCKDDDENTCCDPENPECPNYDPCHGITEPNASFTMEEFLPTGDGIVSAGNDSVFINEVTFSANFQGGGITHKWYLGSQIIEEHEFTRGHTTVPPSQRPASISVSHVIEYPVDTMCYHNISGRDSISRTYKLVKYYNNLNTLGTFRCVFENETDSFDIEMGYFDPEGNPGVVFGNNSEPRATNFHNNGIVWDYFPYIVKNSRAYFGGGTTSRPKGFLQSTEKSNIFKLNYLLYSNNFALTARKID